MIKGLECLSYREKLGLFSLERSFRGDLISKYKYLKGGCKCDEERLFSIVANDWMRVNSHKLEHRMFHKNIRKHYFFFTVRLTEQCHRIPREIMELPSSKLSRSLLDMAMGN